MHLLHLLHLLRLRSRILRCEAARRAAINYVIHASMRYRHMEHAYGESA